MWVGLISVSLSSPFVLIWKTSFWMALQNVGVLLKGVFKPETPFANASFYGLLNTFTDTWWVLFGFLGWERLTAKAMFTCGWAGFSYHTSWNHCDLIKLRCCKADVRVRLSCVQFLIYRLTFFHTKRAREKLGFFKKTNKQKTNLKWMKGLLTSLKENRHFGNIEVSV